MSKGAFGSDDGTFGRSDKYDDHPRSMYLEDGRLLKWGHKTGRAGKSPSSKGGQGNWMRFGRSKIQGGPSRGHSRTGHDRKGGWLFGKKEK